jgi:hypothetical protein
LLASLSLHGLIFTRIKFFFLSISFVVLIRTVWLLMRLTVLGDLGLLFGLLGQQDGLDVWQDTSLGDGDSGQELVQLLVVADGQLQVTGDDSGLLVVASGVPCQLEDLSGQVLHDGSQVDWSSGTDALGVVSFAQETMDTTDRELKTGTV